MHAVEEMLSYRCGNHTGSEFEREAVSVSEVKDAQELRIAERTKSYVLSAPPKGITIYTIAVYCTYVRTVIA